MKWIGMPIRFALVFTFGMVMFAIIVVLFPREAKAMWADLWGYVVGNY